jgi:hypothetical protein
MEKRKRPPLPLDALPQEKYDNLILTIFEEWQERVGEVINFKKIFRDTDDYHELGFHSRGEFATYARTLVEEGLTEGVNQSIDLVMVLGEYYQIYPSIRITYKGFNYCHSLLSSGKNSTRCFVALKYSDDMIPFYDEGIAKAIEDNGFRSFRVDREHAENEQTINDFIIASIKQSRFCVADLTHKSHGAYFEAGYALGRGLKVIYTCRADHFEEVHFDLKNMQIIKYDSPEELREALSLKIQAVILE